MSIATAEQADEDQRIEEYLDRQFDIASKALAVLDHRKGKGVDAIGKDLGLEGAYGEIKEAMKINIDDGHVARFGGSENPVYRLTKKGVTFLANKNQTPVESESLTTEEQSHLETCEATIRGGLQSFVDVGTALAEIRDNRLYRGQFKKFDSYLRERWGLGRSYASRLIGAAETIKVLPKGNTLPTAETQVRPLLQFAPEDRAEVWATVEKHLGGDVPTAAKVEKAIRGEIATSDAAPFKKRRAEQRKAGTSVLPARRDGSPIVARISTSAMQFAGMAIVNLERIQDSDPDRDKALDKVDQYIGRRRGNEADDDVADYLRRCAAVLSDEDLRTLIVVARETIDRIEAERPEGEVDE